MLSCDGKIVVAGNSQGDFAVARLESNGALDSSFIAGTAGRIDFGSDADAAYGAALVDDGTIVVAGSKQQGYNVVGERIFELAVARLLGNDPVTGDVMSPPGVSLDAGAL
jgi:hypothetical protein